MNKPSLLDRIEELGAGVFIRDRNVESRLQPEDFHRAYAEPVTLWVMPNRYLEGSMPALVQAARELRDVRVIRFPNVPLSDAVMALLNDSFPSVRIEGRKTK